MNLICRRCGSGNIIEKHGIPVHKVGVYCADCESWIKWGSIEGSSLLSEGKYVATIISAEEINNLFILIKLETEKGKTIKHEIWKSKFTKKYNPMFIHAMFNGFRKSAREFSSLSDLLTYIKDKKVVIDIEHQSFKGKMQERIVKWGKAENLEW